MHHLSASIVAYIQMVCLKIPGQSVPAPNAIYKTQLWKGSRKECTFKT